jgi:hypothetical protein
MIVKMSTFFSSRLFIFQVFSITVLNLNHFCLHSYCSSHCLLRVAFLQIGIVLLRFRAILCESAVPSFYLLINSYLLISVGLCPFSFRLALKAVPGYESPNREKAYCGVSRCLG